jgi:hypothetical protein
MELAMSKVRLLPFLLLLINPRVAQAEDLYVLLLTPGRAVATKAGAVGAAITSAAGQSSRLSTQGAVPQVIKGFQDNGVEVAATADKYNITSPIPCSVLDAKGTVVFDELPAGRYWLISVRTSGFWGFLGELTGWSRKGLLDNFQASGINAAVCTAAL